MTTTRKVPSKFRSQRIRWPLWVASLVSAETCGNSGYIKAAIQSHNGRGSDSTPNQPTNVRVKVNRVTEMQLCFLHAAATLVWMSRKYDCMSCLFNWPPKTRSHFFHTIPDVRWSPCRAGSASNLETLW